MLITNHHLRHDRLQTVTGKKEEEEEETKKKEIRESINRTSFFAEFTKHQNLRELTGNCNFKFPTSFSYMHDRSIFKLISITNI